MLLSIVQLPLAPQEGRKKLEEAELVPSSVTLGWIVCGGVAELKHLYQGTEGHQDHDVCHRLS